MTDKSVEQRLSRLEAEHKLAELDIVDLREQLDVLVARIENHFALAPPRPGALPIEDHKPRVVVSGSPVDGWTFIGPFASPEAVAAWAKAHNKDSMDWWTAVLEPPTRG